MKKETFVDILINFLLLGLGIVLFTLPQPNFIFIQGIPFLIYFAMIPVFVLVRRASWKTIWLYGIAYGVGCYCFFTSWLNDFHPMAMSLIASLYGFYLMIAFPLLKAAAALFPKKGWLVQWIVWCAYEYIKTLGFTGFHYGVTAYSQWQNAILIQSAALVGVWGLSALLTYPAAWLTGALGDVKKTPKWNASLAWIKNNWLSGALWIVCLVFTVVYGIVSPVDYSADKTVKIALVQPNSDPWIGGVEGYRKNLQTLMQLSDQALAQNSDIDFVVWPETAFVPRIEWHYKYREEREKFELVDTLLNFLNNAPVPFVLGNDDAVMGHTRSGTYDAVDYNAVLLFEPGKNVLPPKPQRYRKMHLVPFTEYFPFEKIFPKIYEALLNGDTHLWEPGTEPTVFTVKGLSFSSPICFEDTFGYISRKFVNNGAQAIVNLSNDAWSKSLACQYQHLSMAVFRSVENRIPSARSTASGQTALIDPNGKVLKMAEPFTETCLVADVPIRDMSKKTLYTRWGDYVGNVFAVMSLGLLVFGLLRKLRSGKK